MVAVLDEITPLSSRYKIMHNLDIYNTKKNLYNATQRKKHHHHQMTKKLIHRKRESESDPAQTPPPSSKKQTEEDLACQKTCVQKVDIIQQNQARLIDECTESLMVSPVKEVLFPREGI